MIKLDKLAIRLVALVRSQNQLVLFGRFQRFEAIEKRIGPFRPAAVGPVIDFHLQQAHVDPHLQHLAAIGGFHTAGHNLARLERPIGEQIVDILATRHVQLEAFRSVFVCA